MEDDEVVLALFFLQFVVIVGKQSVIQGVKFRIAAVKLEFAQFGVIEEEAAAEIEYSLLGLRQEFVGNEGDMIPRLTKEFGEERIVAPLALLAHHMRGEYILEHKTCKVPARHHVRKLGELARPLQSRLPGGSVHKVAILLRVVPAVALAYDEHYVARTEAATVHLHVLGGMDEFGNLVGCQFVGIDTEVESVDGQVKLGMPFLRKGMFHLAYVVASHELVSGHLVGPRGPYSHTEQHNARCGKSIRQCVCYLWNEGKFAVLSGQFHAGYAEPYALDERLSEKCHRHLQQHNQQYPAHFAEDNRRREACRDEVASLVGIGLTHQHQHGRVER